VADGCDQAGGVVVVESGDGVAEVDGDAVGEAGRQQQDAALAALSTPMDCIEQLSKGEHLKTPDGTLAVADGGTTPKVHDGWMWDLTVPGNNDHDFYVAVAATAVLVHNCGEQGMLFDSTPYRASPNSENDTFLYQKLSSTGEHLKYGITKNPATRYTSAELNGGWLNILASGSRQDMLALERSLHETLPIGPEEGQTPYIWIQVAKGLRPPPY
jgi:hypothetical protein